MSIAFLYVRKKQWQKIHISDFCNQKAVKRQKGAIWKGEDHDSWGDGKDASRPISFLIAMGVVQNAPFGVQNEACVLSSNHSDHSENISAQKSSISSLKWDCCSSNGAVWGLNTSRMVRGNHFKFGGGKPMTKSIVF